LQECTELLFKGMQRWLAVVDCLCLLLLLLLLAVIDLTHCIDLGVVLCLHCDIGFHMCIASGYINYACYCASHIASLSLILGEPLAACEKKSRRCLTFAKKLQNQGVVLSIAGINQIACSLSDLEMADDIEATTFTQLVQACAHSKVIVGGYYTQLMQLHYTLDQFEEATQAFQNSCKVCGCQLSKPVTIT
jgi:hypothetical protein